MAGRAEGSSFQRSYRERNLLRNPAQCLGPCVCLDEGQGGAEAADDGEKSLRRMNGQVNRAGTRCETKSAFDARNVFCESQAVDAIAAEVTGISGSA